MQKQFFDTIALDAPRLTRDGYLVSEVRAGRIGIQTYRGSELGISDKDIIRVYRPPDEVFNGDAMASFTSLPVTLDHPPELVSSKNWKKYAVGFTGETCHKDGGFVRVPLAVKDADAIALIQSGDKKELSFGYTVDYDFTPGVTPEGEEYDAVQRNLRGNHLAIVSVGRAGRACRISDDEADDDGGHSMPENLKTVNVDGIPVLSTEAAAMAIDTLQRRIASLTTDNLKLSADNKTALDAKDVEIANLTKTIGEKDKALGTKDGEISNLKEAAPKPEQIDTMVAERADVLAKATAVAKDGDYKGKSVPDVRRIAVAKRLGDAAVKDKSDDYVLALFDTLSTGTQDTTRSDPVADAMRGGIAHQNDTMQAHAAMVQNMTDSWKSAARNGAGR